MGQALVLQRALFGKVKPCTRLVLSVMLSAKELMQCIHHREGGKRVMDTVAPATPTPDKCRPIPSQASLAEF